ncbi:solute carrier family 49 member A3-like [Lytechinus variegatus]|uniref:solute carrier family 49 member A3-like n=1 Tax=Lytechinus variegatus TaxID=7654 RepID=UPI001BB2C2F7|nr:solute carrier family 49 member A3-like [Lytechinus variegatus]
MAIKPTPGRSINMAENDTQHANSTEKTKAYCISSVDLDVKDGERASELDNFEGSIAEPEYRMYKWRWFVVATMAVLNISNAMAWICFAAITNFTAEYFEVSVDAVNWFSLVYLVVAIPMGFVVAWELNAYGFRIAILLGAWLNFLGILLRYLGTVFPIPPSSQFAVVMVGQTLAAFGQPFLLFSPTKMAALWFNDSQRTTGNILATMANPLGILLSFLLSALLVSEPSDVPLMLWVFVIPAAIGVCLATFGICNSAPPTPPSSSADTEHQPFLTGLKMLVKNRHFLILFVTFGGGFGIFNAISTFLEQIVCPIGYNDNFAGLVGALMIGVGLLGAVVAGLIVDKTKAFTPVVKICNAVAIVFVFILSISSKFVYAGAGVLIGGVGFGLFGLAQFSIALELGVECSYPVAEGTSACILQVSGQVQGIILIILGQVLAQPVNVDYLPDQKCIDMSLPNITSAPPTGSAFATSMVPTMPDDEIQTVLDMTIPLFVYAGYGMIITAILILFFRTRYLRLEAEKSKRDPFNDSS